MQRIFQKPPLCQQMLKARSFIESKWDMPDFLPLDQNKYKQKISAWMAEKQRKALEIDFLFDRDSCLICLSQVKNNYSNHFLNVLKNSLKFGHSKLPLHICKQAMFQNFRTLPRIKYLPWLDGVSFLCFTH